MGPSNGIESANECRLLPQNPTTATILHLEGPSSTPSPREDEVQIVLNDGQLAVSVTSMQAALSSCTRQLVKDLGEVQSIRLNSKGARGLRLSRAYGGAPIERFTSDEEQAETAAPLAPTHRCDVLFARRGVRSRAYEACSRAAQSVRRAPVLGGVARAASARLAGALVNQLTPTYEPTLTLRLLKRLPWSYQRLGARLWLQAMLHQEEADEEYEELMAGAGTAGADMPTAVRGSHAPHPMEAVRTLPMLDPAECDAAVREAEAHAAAQGGWLTDRHVAYPTTDIPLRKLPQLSAVWESRVFPALSDAFRTSLSLPLGSIVTPLDVFVVKYDYNGQRDLAVHRDNGLLTFSMLLNDPDEFEGGGTYFEAAGRVYRPTRGVGVLHSALVRHAGYPISRGTRYVLVGFCGLRSPRLPAGFGAWQFGEPPWFVTSRVVSDRQILGRVWPLREKDSSLADGDESVAEDESEAMGGSDGKDEDEFPTLDELYERGELSDAQYAQMSGGSVVAATASGAAGAVQSSSPPVDGMGLGARVRSEFGDGVVRFRGVDLAFAPGEWVGIELDTPTGRNSGSVQGVQYFRCRPNHGLFSPPDKLELVELAEDRAAGRAEEDGTAARAFSSEDDDQQPRREAAQEEARVPEEDVPAEDAPHAAAAPSAARGEKPWYRQQHEAAATARLDGELIERLEIGDEIGGENPSAAASRRRSANTAAMELWRHGDDLVALLVVSADGRREEEHVAGSVVYRAGPLTADMRAYLLHLLPEPAGVRGRLRQLRARRQRLAGMVHVYVEPAWRSEGYGESLTRFSMRGLRAQGFSHALTLADDSGSGKLLEWYAALGFVEAPEFDAPGETAMVARAA